MSTAAWLVLSAVLAGLSRLAIPGHDLSWAGTTEAFEHIWVGAITAFAALTPDRRLARLAWVCLGAATALEVVMFLAR